jgi:hypothetical protein
MYLFCFHIAHKNDLYFCPGSDPGRSGGIGGNRGEEGTELTPI